MKKSTKIIIAVVVLAIIALVVVGIFAFTKLNKEKTAVTAEDFKTKMENKGYIVSDAVSQFAGYDYVKKVYIASAKDYTYQIEYYEFSGDEYAVSFYENNKTIFETRKGNVAAETEINLSNHSRYGLSANGKYSVISRIGNTAIYVNVDDTYKDTVKDILNKLGY